METIEQTKLLDQFISVGNTEGWTITYATYTEPEQGGYRLTLNDETKFDNDFDVARHVFKKAQEGSIPHLKAIEFIEKYAEVDELNFIIDSLSTEL